MNESTALITIAACAGGALMLFVGGKVIAWLVSAAGDHGGILLIAIVVVIGIVSLTAVVGAMLQDPLSEYIQARKNIKIEEYRAIERKQNATAERKVSRAFLSSMPRNASFDYDVALSFAGEDRMLAEELAELVTESGLSVFYDAYEKADLWGKNLYDHLHKLYSERARFCVLFVSKNYEKKAWTNHERKAAQERALNENRDYILPVRIDDTKISGLTDTVGYLDVRTQTIEDVAELLIQKIRTSRIGAEQDVDPNA